MRKIHNLLLLPSTTKKTQNQTRTPVQILTPSLLQTPFLTPSSFLTSTLKENVIKMTTPVSAKPWLTPPRTTITTVTLTLTGTSPGKMQEKPQPKQPQRTVTERNEISHRVLNLCVFELAGVRMEDATKKGCFSVWAVLVETKQIAKGDPGSKF